LIIAFAGKDGRSNGSPTFTCIKKLHDVEGELRRVDEGIQRAKEKMSTIQTRLNILENQKKVITEMKRRKRLR